MVVVEVGRFAVVRLENEVCGCCSRRALCMRERYHCPAFERLLTLVEAVRRGRLSE